VDEETKTALELLGLLSRRGEAPIVTSATADGLGHLGVRLPANTKIEQKMPRDAVCVAALVITPLMFPDNRVRRCSECGTKVQCRPTVPRRAKLVCAPCGLRMARGDA
jgi:hypothetical protein